MYLMRGTWVPVLAKSTCKRASKSIPPSIRSLDLSVFPSSVRLHIRRSASQSKHPEAQVVRNSNSQKYPFGQRCHFGFNGSEWQAMNPFAHIQHTLRALQPSKLQNNAKIETETVSQLSYLQASPGILQLNMLSTAGFHRQQRV